MAVTNFSPLLGLALPTTGDLSGTWGTAVNDQITQLLDSAIAGTVTLSADADVTLSTTNGAANQARNAIIRWTASNGANTRNITAPAQSKAYLIINAGTGSVVIRAAGPTTGITLPAGARALVAFNGSDFVKIASNPAVLTTDVSGILPIANGGTGTSSTTFTNLTTNVTGTLPVARGGTGATTAPAARTGLGATTLGGNLFTLANNAAIRFPRFNADNTVSSLDAAAFRTAIGAGTGGGSVSSVSGTGTVNGISLSGTVTTTGNLTLGGALTGVNLTTQVTGTLPVSNGGTGATTLAANNVLIGNGTSALQVVAPGTSGNVLTSNGTTWTSAAAAAGGTVSGTASGSIASGNPVLVNTNGTFSAPTIALGPANLGAQTSGLSSSSNNFSLVYCTVPGVYALFYRNDSSYLAGRIYTPASDGSISFGTEFVINSASTDAHIAAVYISSDPGKCAVYSSNGAGGAGRIQIVAVTATTLGTGSVVNTGRSDNFGGIAWDPINQIGMVCGSDGSLGRVFNTAFTFNGLTPTFGAPVSSTNGDESNIEYDQNSGYFLTACRANSNEFCIQPATTTASRVVTQFTMTTVASASGLANGIYGMVYVPGPNRVMVTGSQGSPGTVVYFYVTMTGNTPSAVGRVNDTSLTTSGQQKGLGFDAVNNVVVSNFRNSSGRPTVKCIPVNGTTISLGSAVEIDTISASICGQSGKLPFDSVNVRNASYYGGSGVNIIHAKTFKSATSSLTSENFIGFSTASFTNGQTAVVTTIGGTSTTVSGVSVGVKNYVAGTSLTSSVTSNYAGIGLSSTSLLVKG